MIVLRFSEAAAACGAPTSTLRYRERIGLLEPSRTDGYRVYNQAARERLDLLLAIKRLGLPLSQIRELQALERQFTAGPERQDALPDEAVACEPGYAFLHPAAP